MPMPAHIKTWSWSQNNVTAGVTSTDLKTMQIAHKDYFKTVSGVTVIGSSNSVTGALDGVDRWTVSTDLVGAPNGSPRSWIVLQFANINNMQILWTLGSSLEEMYISFAGFSGGTNTTRPTATDEAIFSNATYTKSGSTRWVWHAMSSSDGQQIILTVLSNSILVSAWIIARPYLPPDSWANRGLASFRPTDATIWNQSGIAGSGLATTIARGQAQILRGGAYIGLTSASTTTYLTQANGGVIDTVTGEWMLTPMHFISDTNSGLTGQPFRGWLADVYQAPSARAQQDTYPASGDKEWVQFGSLVLPWGTIGGGPHATPLWA